MTKLKLLFVALGALMISLYITAPAYADGGTDSIQEIRLSALTIQVLVGLFIPIVVGLVTKLSTSSGLKAVLMLVLNAVQTLIIQTTMADGTAVISKQTFIAWVLALVVSVSSYAGVYRPLKLTSSLPDGKLAPTKGI